MIICFSGTGNTLAAARELAAALGDDCMVRLEGRLLDEPEKFDLATLAAPQHPSRIIWAFPTYSWGIPPKVVELMRRISDAGNLGAKAFHHMLTTCGDDMGRTDRQWRRLIRARGWKPEGAYAVRMPNTYTFMKGFDVDSRETASEKIGKMPAEVSAIAADILAREGGRQGADRLIPGAWPRVKSAVIYPYFKKFCMSPAHFRSTGGCTGCGICAKVCPMGNISIGKGGAPIWGSNCAFCLRCYHSCPRNAVAYGKATDGKGRYLFPGFERELLKPKDS